MAKLFPDNFLWGASTAGHQVEGNCYDQWTVWELKNARQLANTAEQRLKNFLTKSQIPEAAYSPENYISGAGVDHFNRYEEDFDLLNKIGLNAFRFGIEWSRLEPEEGKWDKEAINHYRRYIQALKARGIEPVLNLWHWTHPVWFERKGGFQKYGNIGYFLRFITKVAEEYGQDLKYIITLNEPNVYVSMGFITGEKQPGKKNVLKALRVYWHLVKAHKYTYLLLKQANPNLRIGIAANLSDMQPKRPRHLLDRFAAWVSEFTWNWWYLNRIRRQQDFVGINYYMTNYVKGKRESNPSAPKNDLGWYMEPKGVVKVIKVAWKKYKKPVLLAENGVADAKDQYRQWWLKETMQALILAQQAGVELIGYLHWSLLDNFEWQHGWWPKFGLIEVDRENNLRRRLRPSAVWWSKQLRLLPKD